METKILSKEGLETLVKFMSSISHDEEPSNHKYIRKIRFFEEISSGMKIIKAQLGIDGFRVIEISKGYIENNYYIVNSGYIELGMFYRKEKGIFKPHINLFGGEEITHHFKYDFSREEVEKGELFELIQ